MSDTFDPYYEWLGIPKWGQPANAYRLLGISDFEQDGKVIANAADRTMKHLRTYQASKRSQISQKLLNEVANAKITLLDEKSKAQYDAELAQTTKQNDLPTTPEVRGSRSGVTDPPVTSQGDKKEREVEQLSAMHWPDVDRPASYRRGTARRQTFNAEHKRRKSQKLLLAITLGGGALVAAAIMSVLLMRGSRNAEEAIIILTYGQHGLIDPHPLHPDHYFEFGRTEYFRQRQNNTDAGHKQKVTYYENGKKESELHYIGGRLDGLQTYWYESGQKWDQSRLENGRLEGLWTVWYQNGQKESEHLYKKDGGYAYTQWDNNGNKIVTSHHKDWMRHGLWTWWYENGQKRAEGHWNKQKLDGFWIYWDENGHKRGVVEYKDNKPVSVKEF